MRDPLVRARKRCFERTNLGRHQTFVARAKPDKDRVARLQLGNAETTQRLHVDEDILRTLATREEAEAANAVEPLHNGDFEAASWDVESIEEIKD